MIIRIEGNNEFKEIEVSENDKLIFKLNQPTTREQFENVVRMVNELWEEKQVAVIPEFLDIYVIRVNDEVNT